MESECEERDDTSIVYVLVVCVCVCVCVRVWVRVGRAAGGVWMDGWMGVVG